MTDGTGVAKMTQIDDLSARRPIGDTAKKGRCHMATQMSTRMQGTDRTQTAQDARTAGVFSTSALVAILLMLAGWGWNNGQFVQPVATSYGPIADGLHLVPVVALLLLGVGYVRAVVAGKSTRGAIAGVTIVALISIVGCAVMTFLGLTNPDPNSVGVHTFEDAMPAIVLTAGSLLWLTTLLPSRRAKS